MENTAGHLVGFFYMFLLMLQSSLFFTRIHINKYWTFAQEFLVLLHGTAVAITNGNNLWPMFFFGFGGIFIITQMHGLNLKSWIKWTFLALYLAAVALVYSGRGLSRLWEVSAIPIVDYLVVLVLLLILWLIVRLTGWRRPQQVQEAAS